MTMKKMLLVVSLGVVAMMSSAGAFAEDSKAPGSGPNPYADCGIGAAIFTETKWAAVTSNVIWDLGITALISATASPQTCSGKKVLAALFIRDTYAHLAEETAAGQGEHLTTALNIFGCASPDHAVATQRIRAGMAQAVTSQGYSEQSQLDKAAGFYSIIDRAVSSSCSA